MRLIDADALIEALRAKEYETVKHPTFLRSEFEEGFSRGINIAKETIMSAPIANAEPVRQGRWIDHGSYVACSECNEEQYGIDTGRFYCQNCGARMVKGEQDG